MWDSVYACVLRVCVLCVRVGEVIVWMDWRKETFREVEGL